MLALPQEEGDPLIATFGLNSEESSRELLGLPPGGEEARAVTLSYRYGEEEAERDEFRLSSGLALPVPDSSGARIGTLGIFWRRVEREVTEEELEQLEGLAAALGPALTNAFRVEELRRELDVDPATGLRGRRSLRAARRRVRAGAALHPPAQPPAPRRRGAGRAARHGRRAPRGRSADDRPRLPPGRGPLRRPAPGVVAARRRPALASPALRAGRQGRRDRRPSADRGRRAALRGRRRVRARPRRSGSDAGSSRERDWTFLDRRCEPGG